LQQPIILPTTVAENIAYGKPEATIEEIEAAAHAAQCQRFIDGLPKQIYQYSGHRRRGGALERG